MLFRRVEHRDYEDIIELIKEFYEESIKDYGSTLDLDSMLMMFHKLKDTSFVAEENEKITGLLAGEVVTDLLSKESTYAEVMWFMTKEKRKYGIRLLKFVETWVKDQGMRRMLMVHMCNGKADKLKHFYTRIGYRPMEIHYIKEL